MEFDRFQRQYHHKLRDMVTQPVESNLFKFMLNLELNMPNQMKYRCDLTTMCSMLVAHKMNSTQQFSSIGIEKKRRKKYVK